MDFKYIISNLKSGLLVFLVGVFSGCQGQIKEKPPIRVHANMFKQPRYDPQERSGFFADARAQRAPVAGTVPRGAPVVTATPYLTGKDADGQFVAITPTIHDMAAMRRGQERYNIYCAPCHDRAGTSRGLVVTKYQGFPPPPSLHDDRIRQMPDGELFGVITDGVRTMPAYRAQIPVEDRWAIVAYLRALQRSQAARIEDVPPDMRQTLEAR